MTLATLVLSFMLTAAPSTAPPPQVRPPQITPPQVAPLQVAPPQVAPAKPEEITHDVAVEIVARATAAEMVTSANCNDILFNQTLLDNLADRFKIGDADKAAIEKEVHASILRLKQVLKETRHKKDWCDAMLELYGPDGTFVPKLMKR